MTAAGIEFERVRKGKGRVHLTPRIPETGPVSTLCGKTLAAGDYECTDLATDCQSCSRRKDDRGLVSGAFFESDAGMALLELSLAESKRRPSPARKPATSKAPAKPPAKPASPMAVSARPAATPKARSAATAEPPSVPGLECRGLKMLSPTQMESPAGVLIRIREADGAWEVAELDFDGPVHAGRAGARLKLRVGDVTLTFPAPPQRRP